MLLSAVRLLIPPFHVVARDPAKLAGGRGTLCRPPVHFWDALALVRRGSGCGGDDEASADMAAARIKAS